MGREEHCKQILLACVGSVRSGWTTLGLPQPNEVCTSQVYTGQAPGYSAGALSQVGPAFCALPRSKPLRFLGTLQGLRPCWGVHFVPFPGLNSSGDWLLGECTVPGWPCILCTSPIPATWFPWCPKSTVPGVLCVSSRELISGCDTPGRCQPSRIPGRHG